ncbi:hypothetical protein EDD16DRAFT_1582153 [Pisolithus croceorrhizus]|nr:hypothetical protein F5141DRAFT_1006036 [Pisolithus sp. B1]KAI6119435.1 hypothetical protein EDD16DRAFT_1582153 [Pisolithus croceorrhizus]
MCSGPAWKREIVPDHKFDFVDTREFADNGFLMRLKYLWLYIIILKSFLVYISDIFSGTTMLTTSSWSNQIYNDCQHQEGCFYIPFDIGKWLFVGCIIFGFLLLAYEARKSKKIIASRDISYAFTNVMANHYYSLRSYNHFCFFDHISNSTKKKDDFAFFIFFTFKSWKRLLLSDGPRQTINALTLYSIYLAKKGNGPWYNVSKYFMGNSFSTSALMISTFFTFVIFAGSLILLICAGIFYIPLLCYIQGNLKEYVCHKVDKRITEVIKRRNKERLAKAAALARKEAMGDYSHLMNKKGEMIAKPLPQPTLPNLSVDDDADTASVTKRGLPGAFAQDYYHGSDSKSIAPSYHTNPGGGDYADYPPMPPYSVTYSQQGISNHVGDIDDYSSSTNLPAAAAPTAYRHDPYGTMGVAGAYSTDVHELYQGRASPGIRPPSEGGVTRDVQDYPSHPQPHLYVNDYGHYGDPYRQYQGYGEQDAYGYGRAL